jgi:hypothetical protein
MGIGGWITHGSGSKSILIPTLDRFGIRSLDLLPEGKGNEVKRPFRRQRKEPQTYGKEARPIKGKRWISNARSLLNISCQMGFYREIPEAGGSI